MRNARRCETTTTRTTITTLRYYYALPFLRVTVIAAKTDDGIRVVAVVRPVAVAVVIVVVVLANAVAIGIVIVVDPIVRRFPYFHDSSYLSCLDSTSYGNLAESEVVKRENKSILNLRSLDDPIGRSVKHDCSVEIVYSTNDYQCSRLCRGPGKYFSKNGACVNSILKNVNEAEVQTGCDPKSGLLAYIVGDAQFGAVRLQCLSVDPGVRPDDMNKPPL
ncbi:hypothetical protein AGLY_014056 [Aphis glycines]|uniref:Uncharacterized protein n=1 Tax=Aphis glycines TaxID=307491 RepID=A0A6G0T4L5_APHGL|nr:hypothetical protein AGLY_014056 [Aphis glycines]